MPKQHIYRISFINQGKVYEIYANHVGASDMLGFVEISHLQFGEKSSVVLDPGEESLKNEFKRVKRTYIPVHSVIRIDEVEKLGHAKITEAPEESKGNVMTLPMFASTPDGNHGTSS
ncbi:MAG: DUF1820 family protein [Zetaproteobacteria bacterium]|nr:MAG: DUF1820 family protein [Zetaproteobacteria bacterium]